MQLNAYDDNVALLLNAVVVQAARDYRAACRRLKKYPFDEIAGCMKIDAESFFLSEDFSAYSSVDGKQILKMLKEESEAKYGKR